MQHLELDPATAIETLSRFLREEVRGAGFDRAVVGLSGGVDSALVAALAARALGAERILALLLPWRGSSPDSLTDAEEVAERIGVTTRKIDISPAVDVFSETLETPDALRLGNVMARCRMICIFDVAAEIRALPLGTSNRSELLMGYGTLHGDLASAVNPLAGLYKQQVYALARRLELPERVIAKAPSADLEAGQTDESDLGWEYRTIDRVLVRAVDLGWPAERIVADGFDPATVRGILERMAAQRFKGRLPIVPRTTGGAGGPNRPESRDDRP